MGTHRRLGAAILAGLTLATAAACTDDDTDDIETTMEGWDGKRSTTSSPFTVEAPNGYELAVAGTGTYELEWGGGDAVGNDEPLTVLAPPGKSSDSPEAVFVSTTGFENYEGGLEEASSIDQDDAETFEVDGKPAIAGQARGWTEVLVTRGDDLAVRVRAKGAERDDLVAIARNAKLSDSTNRAPQVTAPPDGLRVLGSIDADVAASLLTSGYVAPNRDEVPGTAAAHSVSFLADGEPLTVMALPGDMGDIELAGAYVRWHLQPVTLTSHEVDGRPAVVAEYRGNNGRVGRELETYTAWGDFVMIVSASLSTDQLLDIAGSLQEASDDEWSDLIDEAEGGPGLHADNNAVEVARGTEGEFEWLLQALPNADEDEDEDVVDPCLKLATGGRVCADEDLNHEGLDDPGGFYEGPSNCNPGCDIAAPDGFPRFLVVWTALPGASVELVMVGGKVEADLHEIEGTHRSAAVVFTDAEIWSGNHTCGDIEADPDDSPQRLVRIDIRDDAGKVLGCITGD